MGFGLAAQHRELYEKALDNAREILKIESKELPYKKFIGLMKTMTPCPSLKMILEIIQDLKDIEEIKIKDDLVIKCQ